METILQGSLNKYSAIIREGTLAVVLCDFALCYLYICICIYYYLSFPLSNHVTPSM